MEVNRVRRWIEGDETAKEMLGRVLKERPVMMLPHPLHRVPVRAGNVVEISGPSPSGKTHLLIQAAVNCILPKEWRGVHYGGLGQLVLYIDLDCRFEATRLLQVLRHRIVEARSHRVDRNGSYGSDDELISLCMRRFLYTRCYHSFEFLATLKTLQNRVQMERQSHGARVQMLLIDNVGAFHWVDRAFTASSLGPHNKKSLSLHSVWEAVVGDLRKLLLIHPMLVIASKAAIFGTTSTDSDRHFKGRFSEESSPKHKFREYMPSSWQAFVTHRVLLHTSDEHLATGNYQQANQLEWLLPALSTMDKFAVGDSGVLPAS